MLNLRSLEELAGLLGTSEEDLSRTLKRVDLLVQKLSIKDLEKPDKKPRVVYDPCGRLRILQEALHKKVLQPRFDRSPYSYGGVKRRNHLDCARQHLGEKFVYTCDVRSFYPGIHFTRVLGMFADLGCSAEVARALTRLTTSQHRLEQGFITSPIIADRIFRSADERIARLCSDVHLVYTRYVDDITISGPFDLKKSGIPQTIAKILDGKGFRLHPDKHGYGSITGGATILSLRLNKGRPDVRAKYYEETVRRLKDMASLGEGGEFVGPFFTPAELYGRMQYICWVNPNRRRTLRPLWSALNWKQIYEIAEARGLCVRERRYVIDREPSR